LRFAASAPYAVASAHANRRATFHIKSDSAMFDNIAVPSGKGSSDRVPAACGIGPSWFVSHRSHGKQKLYQAFTVPATNVNKSVMDT